MERPFDAVRRALRDISRQDPPTGDPPHSQPDLQRHYRAGAPEIIYAARKDAPDVLADLITLARANGRAIATRCPQQTIEHITTNLPPEFALDLEPDARAVVVSRSGCLPRPTGGRVGILTAGTSDRPIAAEAALLARELGCETRLAYDVGVAGLHRLIAPLESMAAWDADVLIVVAGMDGALWLPGLFRSQSLACQHRPAMATEEVGKEL